jgi:hypothetical protein
MKPSAGLSNLVRLSLSVKVVLEALGSMCAKFAAFLTKTETYV